MSNNNNQTTVKRVLGLPDVDPTQPDTFETPDIPEPITNLADEQNELVNENIDRRNLVPAKAHLKFANRKFNNKSEDFSDSIYKRQQVEPRTGGLLRNQTEFDILPSDSDHHKIETPLQKFQRLQFEVINFRQEMQAIADNGGEVEKDIKGIDITHQLADLQNQLGQLLENEKLLPILDENRQVLHYSQIQNKLSEKLITEISSLAKETDKQSTTEEQQKESDKQPQPQPQQQKDKNGITYDIYYTSEQPKFQQLQRVADLEKRLAKLETLAGNKSDSIPITQSILEIKEKLSLLDTTKIDVLSQKMKTATKEIESFKTQDESLTKSLTSNEKKINEIYDLMTRWDTIGQQVPAIINRLYTLRSLHEDGISFSNHLTNLEKQQNDITSLLKSNSGLINKMDDSFKSNLIVIKSNIESIEKRISNVDEKIKAAANSKKEQQE
ncbi:hypothetical protein CYY_006447 [Polysphondylium violaceum]|uniref:Dynactin subunit 2 n=1 Tax=Polysphondylium violaceum TaxID=133409 RepID=A0A8J4PRW2_9MYCE|nr:hypothetical protein CYY_006447 [Polysphondylium violaceum]